MLYLIINKAIIQFYKYQNCSNPVECHKKKWDVNLYFKYFTWVARWTFSAWSRPFLSETRLENSSCSFSLCERASMSAMRSWFICLSSSTLWQVNFSFASCLNKWQIIIWFLPNGLKGRNLINYFWKCQVESIGWLIGLGEQVQGNIDDWRSSMLKSMQDLKF